MPPSLSAASASVAPSFAALADADHPLHPALCAALASLGFLSPTHIQRQAFLPISRQQDVVLAAETGCGKTLAYLLPVLNALLSSPISSSTLAAASPSLRPVSGGLPLGRSPCLPRAILVTINRELCAQLHDNVSALLQRSQLSLSFAVLTGSSQLPASSSYDLLITTPTCLDLNAQRLPTLLSACSHLVLDEADMLLSSSPSACSSILNALRRLRRDSLPSPAVAFVAATLNRVGELSVHRLITRRFPALSFLSSSLFHSNQDSIRQRWLQVRGEEDRQRELLAVLEQAEQRRVLVFCNTVERVRQLERWLLQQGGLSPSHPSPSQPPFVSLQLPSGRWLQVAAFHNYVPVAYRIAIIRDFNRSEAQQPASASPPLSSSSSSASLLPPVRVLLCSNLASRGVDFQRVQTVVQYDFALSVVEHLHRAGRTGRLQAGQREGEREQGTVVNLWEESFDGLLVREVRKGEVEQQAELQGFSRRRSLRRKFKKQQKLARDEQAVTAGRDELSQDEAEQRQEEASGTLAAQALIA